MYARTYVHVFISHRFCGHSSRCSGNCSGPGPGWSCDHGVLEEARGELWDCSCTCVCIVSKPVT